MAAIELTVTILLSLHCVSGDPSPRPRVAAVPHQPLAVIVNKSNPTTNLSFDELRRIFLAEKAHWPNGRRITIVMRESGQLERNAVLRAIYRMTEEEFDRYFLQATFTGQALGAPKTVSTAASMRKFVFYVPGAIGYVRADELDDSIIPIRIDGLAPGDAGYRLKLQVR